jgi:hypothetical protein
LRGALLERLNDEGEADLARRLGKCGLPLRLVCTRCSTFHDVLTRCDLKWCPACQHALAARTAARYANIMALCQWPLRVTLTARNYRYEELHGMREVRRAWSRFRRLRWFRKRVPGGVTAFEITEHGKGWHIHCHGLWDCRWLAVDECEPARFSSRASWKKKAKAAASEVGEQWALCCDRPASIQVRRVWKRDNGDIAPALAETLKYSVKGTDLVASAHRVGPLIRMLDGTRMVTSFGTFHGRPECKRVRLAAQPCECGATGTLVPMDAMIAGSRDERGLTARQARH